MTASNTSTTVNDALKHLRSLLTADHDTTFSELPFENTVILDALISEISFSENSEALRHQLEDNLQDLYHNTIVHESLFQWEVFAHVLDKLKPILLPSSVIQTWFDLVLRPALREPALTPSAAEHAKCVIVTALQEEVDKVVEFRQRVVDLYLLDAPNESSGQDLLDWADMLEEEREKRMWWKNNLENVLVTFGLQMPTELLDILGECYKQPTSRLQVLTLIDSLISHPAAVEAIPVLIKHGMFTSLLLSLQLDNSSSLCACGISVIIKLLPIGVVNAYETIRGILPALLVILARIVCWNARQQAQPKGRVPFAMLVDEHEAGPLEALEQEEERIRPQWSTFAIKEEVEWEPLQHTFDFKTPPPPPPDKLFSFMYYLFPCNLVAFLRRSASYLLDRNLPCPYIGGWEEVLDEGQIRSSGQALTSRHVFHTSILWTDVHTELEHTARWAPYDTARIVGECTTLELSHAALARVEADTAAALSSGGNSAAGDVQTEDARMEKAQTPTVRLMNLVPDAKTRRAPLHILVTTAVAMKTGRERALLDPRAGPAQLFQSAGSQPMLSPQPPASEEQEAQDEAPAAGGVSIPANVLECLAVLQREVMMLRNELNVELYLKRECVRHVGRLQMDYVTSRRAELERQSLHNTLRELRVENMSLKQKNRQYESQSADIKQKQSDWMSTLRARLTELQEQKRTWMAEATELRAANAEAKQHLNAQGELLAEAQKRVFDLETRIKEDAHKVQRLRDYERRIEQLTTMHRLWNEDIRLYNEQSQEMQAMVSEYQKMKLRLESYEKTQAEMDATARTDRHLIDSLQANLRHAQRAKPDQDAIAQAAKTIAEQKGRIEALTKANRTLLGENSDLQEQVELLQAAADSPGREQGRGGV